MDRWITGIIVLIILITTFIFIAVVPKNNYFYSNVYKELSIFTNTETYKKIQDETKDIVDTFPIYVDKKIVEENVKLIPNLYELLRSVPDVRNIFITVLKTKTKTSRHQGSKELANYTLRCILPLKISAMKKSGVWLDGKTVFFDQDWVIYDDSREHNLFNSHKFNKTTILVLDIDRPSYMPMGISEIETKKIV